MTISFVETMRGWMQLESGEPSPISFELVARRREFGCFDVRGILAMPALIPPTPARGTLRIGRQAIAYQLDFETCAAATGVQQRMRLNATKHPKVLSPLASMTAMEATVRDERGQIVASGQMRFDVRELPSFLASWIPRLPRQAAKLDVRRRTLERRLLDGEAAPHGESA